MSVVHANVGCARCQCPSIEGPRFKCSECQAYDVCEACHASDNHEEGHYFFKIYKASTLADKFEMNPTALYVWSKLTGREAVRPVPTADLDALHLSNLMRERYEFFGSFDPNQADQEGEYDEEEEDFEDDGVPDDEINEALSGARYTHTKGHSQSQAQGQAQVLGMDGAVVVADDESSFPPDLVGDHKEQHFHECDHEEGECGCGDGLEQEDLFMCNRCGEEMVGQVSHFKCVEAGCDDVDLCGKCVLELAHPESAAGELEFDHDPSHTLIEFPPSKLLAEINKQFAQLNM
eukprot:TRINITY_DN1724_c0_g1_i1.p1 TRINITY_DN1724_c0_g1~~TRINITY_DN1724_c0_g1_i1.p1  ORF type:complete len:315 (+),score=96.11 TRINITY_DN1724_c0_g1_i1:73-945(+)